MRLFSALPKLRAALAALALAATVLAHFGMGLASLAAAPLQRAHAHPPAGPHAQLLAAAHEGCAPEPAGAPDPGEAGRVHACLVLCCLLAPAPLTPLVGRSAARGDAVPVPGLTRRASLARAPPAPPPRA